MKLLLSVLAAILTGCGGHFINRRWDRGNVKGDGGIKK